MDYLFLHSKNGSINIIFPFQGFFYFTTLSVVAVRLGSSLVVFDLHLGGAVLQQSAACFWPLEVREYRVGTLSH